jgi:GNAT superfamily N-acetyltransferase
MIKDTLYAKYIKERQGREILENEDGFIIYEVIGKECFIADMFVVKDVRNLGVGADLIKKLILKNTDCEIITATIWLWDKGAKNTLRAAMAVGFELLRTEPGCLIVAKNIKREV